MQSMALCPTCRILLNANDGEATTFECGRCSGSFQRQAGSQGAEPATLVEILPDGLTPLSCPDCLAPMSLVGAVIPQRHRCAACGGTWQEPQGIDDENKLAFVETPIPPHSEPDGTKPSLIKSLLYGISLPERVLRSAVGVTAGTAREAAQLMIPQAFQSSKSYEVAIANSLNFLTETVGGFESQTSSPQDAGEHIAKKAIGNFVDIAGMATLHVSPMWILAAVSDIAYGSSTYLKELAVELEKQGIIDQSSSIHNVDDMLSAIQNTSGNLASSFDKPPLSVQELKDFVQETRQSLGKAELRQLLPENEVRRYWESMQAIAKQEKITPYEAATAVAMHTAQQATTITFSTLTGVKVAGSLLQRNVLQHYQDSLTMLRQEGFLKVLQATYQPYVGHVWNNFSTERKSWTESLLDPDRLFKYFQKPKPSDLEPM